MLFKQKTLKAIGAGEVTLAFRRWKRPTVRPGGTLTTNVGVLAIDTVEETTLGAITEADATAAGHESIAALKAALGKATSGSLYRITFSVAGEDPRKALRAKSRVSPAEMEDIQSQLECWDRASPTAPWTKQYLRLIERHPGQRAPDLADGVGIGTAKFKTNVRKLKSIGLTISLEVGYQLSPRGETVLGELQKAR